LTFLFNNITLLVIFFAYIPNSSTQHLHGLRALKNTH